MTGRLLAPDRIQSPRLRAVTVSLAAVLACVAARPPLARAVEDTPGCADAWRERVLEGDDDGSRPASQAILSVDVANNAYIARVIEGRIEIGIVGSSFETNLAVSGGLGAQADPALVTTSAGVTFVAFSESTGDTPESRRDVFLARIAGGSLGAPLNLSAGGPGGDGGDNDNDHHHGPRIALDPRGRVHLGWTRTRRVREEAAEERGQSSIFYWNDTLEAPLLVADQGESPSVFVSASGQVYLAYVRGHDIAYVRGGGDGVFEPEAPVTTSALTLETTPSVVVDAAETIMIVHGRWGGGLYLTRKPPGADGFDPPERLETGGVLAPGVKLTPLEELLIIYIKNGDVFHLLGPPGSLGDPVRITETDALERQPTVDIDSNGTVHAAFLRDSVARYVSNACAPDVDFSADPRSGRVPLTVRFTDLSSPNAERWEWDFGDGGVSRSQNPEHIYQEPGLYTVRLRVSAPGGVASTREIEEFVAVQDPLNSLEILDQQMIPGSREMWFPVIATHVEPIQGFQLMGTYDPVFLQLLRTDLAFTTIHARGIVPEFFQTRVFEAHFEVGCVFDLVPPFDGTTLPPGERRRLAHLIFDIATNAPQGETTEVRLVNDKRISRIVNIFIVGGFNRLPALKGSTVKIRVIEPPFPRVFVRGDFDNDGGVTVSDAIALLGFLFQGSAPPACLDAADFGDVGHVDLNAAVGILNFLFGYGRAPAPPFPSAGLDPSEDDLGECTI